MHEATVTARGAGLVSCHVCGRVHRPGVPTCLRCGSTLRSREADSLQRTVAWLVAGLIVYIPANLYPMLRTSTLLGEQESTIVGGAIDLIHHGSAGIAIIVLVASVLIPVGKFLAIGYLVLAIRRRWPLAGHSGKHLYEVVEFIGRWSMIDVFVVAILSALVQLDSVATITPGIAAVSFALSVAFTMLSAQSIDPRLLWDASEATQ